MKSPWTKHSNVPDRGHSNLETHTRIKTQTDKPAINTVTITARREGTQISQGDPRNFNSEAPQSPRARQTRNPKEITKSRERVPRQKQTNLSAERDRDKRHANPFRDS